MVVYLIKNNINGKIYVGKTVMTVKRRWDQHCKSADNISKPRQRLVLAIKKYGREAFTISTLAIATNGEELNRLECHFIKTLNSQNQNIGYNIRSGGDGFSFGNKIRSGTNISPQHKSAISVANKHPKSPETKARMKAAQQSKIGKSWGCHTEETKARISRALRGKKKQPKSLETRAILSLRALGIELTPSAIAERMLVIKARPQPKPTESRGVKLIGIPRPPEVRQKISEAQIGKPKSDETRARMSASAKDRHLSQETKSKIAAKLREHHAKKKNWASDYIT